MKKLTSLLLLSVLFWRVGYCQRFQVSYTTGAYSRSFSGKVLLYLNKDNRNPKDGMPDLENFPCFAITVKNVNPGDEVLFDDKAVSYPVVLSDLEKGDYYVQAVWDRNLGGRAIAGSSGNIYSTPMKVRLTKDTGARFNVVCDQLVAGRAFVPTTFVKELRVASELLSKSQGRSVTVDAAILLPREYFSQPQRRFPVVYNVSGYGGDYHRYSGDTANYGIVLDTVSCITVYLKIRTGVMVRGYCGVIAAVGGRYFGCRPIIPRPLRAAGRVHPIRWISEASNGSIFMRMTICIMLLTVQNG
jgi:hypothetical protein